MRTEDSELLRSVDPAELGARVRAARVQRGLTQTDLGGDGVSTGYVSRIESGARRPTLAVLAHIAERLDTTPEQLLRGVPRDECEEIRLLLNYAELALETGEVREAETQARAGLQRAVTAGQSDLRRRATYLLGRAVEAQGRVHEAIAIYEELAPDLHGLALAECGIALTRCHRDVGDVSLAIDTGERIAARLSEAGLLATDESVRLTITLASAYAARGDLHHAEQVCRQLLETAERIDSPATRASALWNASHARAEAGATDDAIVLAERALALLGEGNDARNLARLRAQLGRLLLRVETGDPAAALAHLTRAREELTASSASAAHVAMADLGLAQAHLASDAPEAAEAAAEQALLNTPDEMPELRAEILVALAQARLMNDSVDGTRATLDEARSVLQACGGSRAAAAVWTQLAVQLEEIGDTAGALLAYRTATTDVGLTAQSPVVRRRADQRR
ncbi:helix-turn-helix domain-containing protein [Nocardioides montaniterrae]